MDFEKPPCAFVLVDGVLAPRLFRSLYRRYAQSLEVEGDEAVLELGCGSGGVAEHLAPRLAHGSLTCVDICPQLIKIARRRLRAYQNVQCHISRIGTLRLPDESFDLIVIHNALHDIPESERSATVLELGRILKPKGRLALREPTKPSHGMPSTAYRQLITTAGLMEQRAAEYKVFPAGLMFDAVFAKPDGACQSPA